MGKKKVRRYIQQMMSNNDPYTYVYSIGGMQSQTILCIFETRREIILHHIRATFAIVHKNALCLFKGCLHCM